jgi:hypothetical protein
MVGLINVRPAYRRDINRWFLYAGEMRYPDGGGLTEQARVKREQVRQQAAGWFAEGAPVPEVPRR